MPKSTKYSYISKNDLSYKVIEGMDSSIVNKFSPAPTITCPNGSYLDTENISPQPQQKPCHCIGSRKWIATNGTC